MKYIVLLTLTIGLFTACQTEEVNDDIAVSTKNIEVKPETVVVEAVEEKSKSGEFIEKYPNGNIQTEGWNNEEGLRDGIWYSYYENGVKWGETSYKNGLKEGHSIVFYPNGKVRYMGDYANDVKVGHWVFYLESGEIDTEEDY